MYHIFNLFTSFMSDMTNKRIYYYCYYLFGYLTLIDGEMIQGKPTVKSKFYISFILVNNYNMTYQLVALPDTRQSNDSVKTSDMYTITSLQDNQLLHRQKKRSSCVGGGGGTFKTTKV